MGKFKTARRSLRFAGQFERRCRCILHDDNVTYARLFKTSGKDFEKKKLESLIKEKLISPRAKWICSNCLLNKSNTMEPCEKLSPRPSSSKDTTSICSCDHKCIDCVIDALNKGLLQEDDVARLSKALGESMREFITTDIGSLSGVYKDMDVLSKLCCKDFIEKRPGILVQFVNSICSIDLDKAGNKKLSAYCQLIEQLYFLKNLNFIGPFSFSNNIVKWTFTGSKTCVALDGASMAAGSVTTLKKILNNASVEENNCFSSGDVDVFFDNTQRIGKTRRVREGGSTPMNVATNVVFIQNCVETNIQTISELIPENWMSKKTDGVSDLHVACLTDFQTYKRKTQSGIIDTVLSEIVYDTESMEFKDHVSVKTFLHSMDINKNVCVKCMTPYDQSAKICPNCSHDSNFLTSRIELYSDVPSCHFELPAMVKMGEVIGVNPNSRESVKEVLKNVLKQCDVGRSRKWVRIGCDGVPYSIADSLIDSLVICPVCNEELDLQIHSFETHVFENNCGVDITGFKKVFGNVLLTPGAGHIEINLLRSCFAFCKHIFIEHVANILGFCSQRAKDFIVNCGNHHLSWQIAMVIYHAFSQEIIYTYVTDQLKTKQEPTFEGFLTWKQDVKNVNIIFYYDLIFNIFLGLKCFRSGIRKNNSVYSLAGRQSASLMFFLGRHRIYQKLICRDLEIRSSAPLSVKNYLQATESYSVSGDCTKGEGGDYITENQNRTLKQHLPPGVPTFSTWQTASRCDETLRKIRESVFHRLCMKDPGTEDTVTLCHDNEVQMLRRVIRSSKLFNNVHEDVPLLSLNGTHIHADLLYFLSVASDNFTAYVKEGPGVDMKPVFTTYAEEAAFNDVNTWTVKKIKSEIKNVLDSFSDDESSSAYMDFYKQNVEKQNKNAHIQFLNEIKSAKEASLIIDNEDNYSDE